MRNKKLIVLFAILGSITLLAVLNSIIFSIQHVEAYCESLHPRDEIDDMLEDSSYTGIKRGRSIFLLNEKKVIQKIESQAEFASIEIINIQRKFPNRVYVNYRRVYPFFVYETDSGVYYVSSGLKILSEGERQDTYTDAIRLIADAPTGGPGGVFFEKGTAGYNRLLAAATGAEMYFGYGGDAVELIESIDATAKIAEYGKTCYKMRSGVTIEIVCNDDSFFDKLRLAFSYYVAHKSEPIVTRGTIKVWPGDSVPVYVPEGT